MVCIAKLGTEFQKCRSMQLRDAALGHAKDIGNLVKSETMKVVVTDDFLVSHGELADGRVQLLPGLAQCDGLPGVAVRGWFRCIFLDEAGTVEQEPYRQPDRECGECLKGIKGSILAFISLLKGRQAFPTHALLQRSLLLSIAQACNTGEDIAPDARSAKRSNKIPRSGSNRSIDSSNPMHANCRKSLNSTSSRCRPA